MRWQQLEFAINDLISCSLDSNHAGDTQSRITCSSQAVWCSAGALQWIWDAHMISRLETEHMGHRWHGHVLFL